MEQTDMQLPAGGRIGEQMRFAAEADKLKSVLRRTLLADGSRRENDAEHSWHMALLAMLLYEYAADPQVNLLRVLQMALLHDMVEIYAGDTFAYDESGKSTQAERETAAADRLFALLPPEQGTQYRTLWEEFDARVTPDALYAAAIDCLQPLLNNYQTGGHTWKLGDVDSEKVYARIEPVKRALPQVWPYIEGLLRDSIEKGWLRP